MKSISITLFFILASICAYGQAVYTKAFGDPENKPIVFLHGGPGYNCANFEVTTAQLLADKGFYVVVYDRRGEGRSMYLKATYTFAEAIADLEGVFEKYELEQATLIGHSFGGMLATLFAEAHPNKVASIIYVGAPVSLQESFKNIIAKSTAIYTAKKDSTNLKYMALLEKMDSSSIQYSSYCFAHAMQNGFYTPKQLSDEAKALYATFQTDSILLRYASQMSYQAPRGFWQNEKYTTLDLAENIKSLREQGVRQYGLYGKDDGLYAAQQVEALGNLIGADNLIYLDHCSHNVFIDQQTQFLDAVKTWVE